MSSGSKNTEQKNNVEERLFTAVAHATPNLRDSIVQQCYAVDEKRNSKEYWQEKMIPADMRRLTKQVNRTKKKSGWVRGAVNIAVAVAAIMLAFTLGMNHHKMEMANRVNTIIAIDVNPSLEFKVNENDRVVDVDALNQEATIILADMDLRGTQTSVAINAVLGAMLTNGYLNADANSILVSVNNQNADECVRIEEQVVSDIDTMLQACSIQASILSQSVDYDTEIMELANQYGVSVGRMTLIMKIIEQSDIYEISDLTSLTINELNYILTVQNYVPQDVNCTGTVSESCYIGQEKAIQIALANQGFDSAAQVEDLSLDVEIMNARMVYCVRFTYDNIMYGYKIDALNGAISSVISGVPDEDSIQNTPDASSVSDNSVSENTVSENSISENSISENSVSENSVSENTVSGNQVDTSEGNMNEGNLDSTSENGESSGTGQTGSSSTSGTGSSGTGQTGSSTSGTGSSGTSQTGSSSTSGTGSSGTGQTGNNSTSGTISQNRIE